MSISRFQKANKISADTCTKHTSETGRSGGIIHVISTRMDFINDQSLLGHAVIKSLIISIKQLDFNGSLARPDCCTPLGRETMSA